MKLTRGEHSWPEWPTTRPHRCRTGTILLFCLVLGAALAVPHYAFAAEPDASFTVAQLKYRGGGDWYANPTALPNLLQHVRDRTDIDTAGKPATVSLDDEKLFLYPMIYMTGHGRIFFTEEEASNLRDYLERGGFLWADDNYGMDSYFRQEIRKVLPEDPILELPFEHEIFRSFYKFEDGLPKIHEHDGGPPHAYGIFHDGRMAVFYSFNTDIGDGMEDTEVHNDPPEKRQAALMMGTNVVVYALTH